MLIIITTYRCGKPNCLFTGRKPTRGPAEKWPWFMSLNLDCNDSARIPQSLEVSWITYSSWTEPSHGVRVGQQAALAPVKIQSILLQGEDRTSSDACIMKWAPSVVKQRGTFICLNLFRPPMKYTHVILSLPAGKQLSHTVRKAKRNKPIFHPTKNTLQMLLLAM